MCITEHFCNADGVPQPPERCLELQGVTTRKKQGSESLRRPAACYPYAPGFAHGETGTDCRSKLHMHMHIIIVLLRLIVVYPFPQDLSAPGWLRCLQYTPLLQECQHFFCTFMQERCKFDKLHKPTGLTGYRLAKNLQKCYTMVILLETKGDPV